MLAPATPASLFPILSHIQTHLDDDLSLETLARLAGHSPFHLHRVFRSAVGETIKAYTLRLRLERAAYSLVIQKGSILEIALGLGFNTHETFTRAFKRHFGVTPQAYREFMAGHLRAEAGDSARQILNQHASRYQLSSLRVRQLNPIPVIFIQHLGPYVDVDVTLFDQLIDWATRRNLYTGSNLLIGIGHDAPSVTAPDQLRFDACLQVTRPVRPDGRIGFQVIPEGHYAGATYVGPYGPTMEAAYVEIFQGLQTLQGYQVIGLPAIEIYRTTRINPDYEMNETDIFLPVTKLG
jgi:AraC family transcriptional regulator